MELKGAAVGHVVVLLGAENQGSCLGIVQSLLLGAPVFDANEAVVIGNVAEIESPLGIGSGDVVSEGTESGGGAP